MDGRERLPVALCVGLLVACGSSTPAPREPAAVATLAPTPPATTLAPRPPDRGEPWVVTVDPSDGFDLVTGIAVDATGVYVLGHLGVHGKWRLERRDHADGALVWHVQTLSTTWGARAIALAGDAVYVAGDDRIEKRSLVDGTLITTFGDGGIVRLPQTVIHDVGVTEHSVYAIGEHHAPPNGLWVQRRTTSSGDLERAFGQGGTLSSSAGTRSNFWLAGAVAGNRLVVAGFQSTSDQWRLDGVNALDGRALAGFGSGGTVQQSGFPGGAADVAISGDAVYTFARQSWRDAALWRMERRSIRTGGLVWTETFDPSALWQTTGGRHQVAAVAADAAGAVFVGTRSGGTWLVRAVDPNGRSPRHWVRDPTPHRDEPGAVALTDRFIYVAGFEMVAPTQNTRWRIERISRSSIEPAPTAAQPVVAQPAPPVAAQPVPPNETFEQRQIRQCQSRGPNCRWVADSPCLGRGARCMDPGGPSLGAMQMRCYCHQVDRSGRPVLPQ